MNKTSVYLVLLIIGALAFLYFNGNNEASDQAQDKTEIRKDIKTPDRTTTNDPPPNAPGDLSKVGFKGKKFIYTRHADCRMNCREIDAYEVSEILTSGTINKRKSDPNDKPCPTYAYEGYSRDNQRIRAVIAECDSQVKLVTVIDLDNEYRCNCN